MSLRRQTPFGLLICAALISSCRGASVAPGKITPAQTATLERLTLPPAWTATPSETPLPPTPTASATLHPAVIAARQTATLWPTVHIVAVGAGADPTGWKRIEFGSGSFLVPATFEAVDMGGFDKVIVAFMKVFASGMVDMMEGLVTPVPGAATPTPLSLDELDTAFDFDFLVAADRRGQASVFLVGEPLPEGLDLESMMTEAVGSVQGEVEVVSREIVGGAPLPTGRVYLRQRDPATGATSDQVMYVIVAGDRAWTLSYQARDFQAMLPVFETSALSLTPTP